MSGERLLDRLARLTRGKRVLILGYGKEGRSTYRVLSDIGGCLLLDIADSNAAVSAFAPAGITIIGDGYFDALDNYDIVFKSPGIVLPGIVRNRSCRISSQTDVFLSEYSNQTIGVTGTKGKSTVVTMLHHILGASGYDSVLAGNIGTPVFDIATQITQETIVVAELSCHQLEYCEHSPASALLLNLYEDHLDHYGTFERYIKAKMNIYRYQRERDVLYTHLSNLPLTIQANSQVRDVNTEDLPFTRFEDIDGVKLRGQHNLLNVAFAYNVCFDIGVGADSFVRAIRSYTPLPHRLEFIGSKNGVDYYDDSISTTVESSICAVESVPNAKTLILGGMDRGIDYAPLVDFLIDSNLTLIIGMYVSGKRVHDMCLSRTTKPNSDRFIYADDLYKATRLAQELTRPGTACLLSPAAASYDDFTNFEERGNVFKQLLFD